jgi:hypothetical protein
MKRRPAHKIQKKKKVINRGNKKVIYRTLIAFSLFLVSVFFLGFFLLYQRLNSSFASASDFKNTDYTVISDQFPTLVYAVVDDLKTEPLIIKELKYLIFDRSNKKVLVYSIPVGYRFDIAGKYGEEEISKVLALGALNSENPLEDGAKFLKNTVLKIFGFKVDRFLIVSNSSRYLFDDLLGNGSYLDLLRLKDFLKIRDEFRTDLSLEEFYNLFTFVKSIPNDRLIGSTLSQKDFEDTTVIDTAYEDISLDSYLSSESKNIAVLNGTDISGIANLGARVVQNMGGRVVALGNTDKTYAQSVIVCDDLNSETCKFLRRVFNINNTVEKAGNYVQEHEVDRSDIVVILGFDTSGELY